MTIRNRAPARRATYRLDIIQSSIDIRGSERSAT
jgi:hypothetical protein